MGVLSLKSSNERGPGAKPLAEDSCIAFHDGKINSRSLPPSCTHVCFGVHAVTPLADATSVNPKILL